MEGVYIIKSHDDAVLYVGQSQDIEERVNSHPRRFEFGDRFSIVGIPVEGEHNRKATEKSLIDSLSPKLNGSPLPMMQLATQSYRDIPTKEIIDLSVKPSLEDLGIVINQLDMLIERVSDIYETVSIHKGIKKLHLWLAHIERNVELEQKIKIARLKIERKIGGWLSENIIAGRPSKNQSDDRVFVSDLGLDHNQSSRWQLIATVPDGKFNSWVDERLAKGYEITAGGLRMYARNLRGDPMNSSNLGSFSLVPRGCALRGYAIKCDGPTTGGHIINKSKTRGNAEGRAILATCPKEIMTDQCAAHNIARWADTPDAVRIMLLQKIYEFGWNHMKGWFETFLKTFKVRPKNLELERLLL